MWLAKRWPGAPPHGSRSPKIPRPLPSNTAPMQPVLEGAAPARPPRTVELVDPSDDVVVTLSTRPPAHYVPLPPPAASRLGDHAGVHVRLSRLG